MSRKGFGLAIFKYAFLLIISFVAFTACKYIPNPDQAPTPVRVTITPVLSTEGPTSTLPPQPTSTATTEPTITMTPTPDVPACLSEKGKIVRVKFDSILLKDSYNVSVYTPPCYGVTPDIKYPVVYLLHGQNMDDTSWLQMGAADIADRKIAEGGKPFLIVFPHEILDFDPMTSSKFGLSVVTELIPWVEDNYQVCTERAYRAIGGISRGGGWAIRLGLRNFDLFGSIGGHSPSVLESEAWWAQHMLETHTVTEFPRIYIDRGDKDFLAGSMDYFDKTLTFLGIPHEYHIYPGDHYEPYWRAHIEEYIEWYMQGWP